MNVMIYEILNQKGKTLFWLSKESEYDFASLKKFADGESRSIGFQQLEKICWVLGCEVGDVLKLD